MVMLLGCFAEVNIVVAGEPFSLLENAQLTLATFVSAVSHPCCIPQFVSVSVANVVYPFFLIFIYVSVLCIYGSWCCTSDFFYQFFSSCVIHCFISRIHAKRQNQYMVLADQYLLLVIMLY